MLASYLKSKPDTMSRAHFGAKIGIGRSENIVAGSIGLNSRQLRPRIVLTK